MITSQLTSLSHLEVLCIQRNQFHICQRFLLAVSESSQLTRLLLQTASVEIFSESWQALLSQQSRGCRGLLQGPPREIATRSPCCQHRHHCQYCHHHVTWSWWRHSSVRSSCRSAARNSWNNIAVFLKLTTPCWGKYHLIFLLFFCRRSCPKFLTPSVTK